MIRRARADEIEAIGEVERSSDTLFRGTHLDWAVGKWPPPYDRYRRAIGEGRLWVWEEDGKLAGFVCTHAMDGLVYVDQLSVGAGFQRRGIGRALMRRAISEARSGFPAIALITDRLLPWNRPFYASLGFDVWSDPSPGVQAELEDEYEDGFDPETRIAMILRFQT